MLVALVSSPGCTALFGFEEYQTGSCERPAEGTYRYVGAGTASLTLANGVAGSGGNGGGSGGGGVAGGGGNGAAPPLEVQSLGPEMPVQVRHGDACNWDFVIMLGASREDTTSYDGVRRATTMDKRRTVQSQQWLGLPAVITELSCDQAPIFREGMQVGDTVSHLCGGTNSELATTIDATALLTYQARELEAIAGTQVDTHRFREVTLYSSRDPGVLFGTNTATTWFDVRSGLPLKHEATVVIESHAMLEVTYDETSNWERTDL